MKNLRVELKDELEAAGLFGHRPGAVYLKALLLAGATGGLFAAMVLAPSVWLKVPLFLLAVAVSIGFVMLGHDSGHGAVSRNRALNDLLGFIAFPLVGGLSLTYWRYKHNTLHHAYVNVDGKDPDIRIYPFAMHREQRSSRRGLARFVQMHQGLLFWPLTLLTTFAMRWDGLRFLFTAGRRLVRPASDRHLDAAFLLGHLGLWLALPLSLGIPLWPVLVIYVAWSLLSGLLLAAIFIPAHMTLPLYGGYEDNFILQVQCTQNLRTNRLFSYLLVGLDHQVEHHLFQRMSHLNVKKAAPIVRAFCARHGLPYHEQSWGPALVATTRRLDTLPDHELVPLPPRFYADEANRPRPH